MYTFLATVHIVVDGNCARIDLKNTVKLHISSHREQKQTAKFLFPMGFGNAIQIIYVFETLNIRILLTILVFLPRVHFIQEREIIVSLLLRGKEYNGRGKKAHRGRVNAKTRQPNLGTHRA